MFNLIDLKEIIRLVPLNPPISSDTEAIFCLWVKQFIDDNVKKAIEHCVKKVCFSQ
jgi:hypothetical protein